jgi:hypothetical protein
VWRYYTPTISRVMGQQGLKELQALWSGSSGAHMFDDLSDQASGSLVAPQQQGHHNSCMPGNTSTLNHTSGMLLRLVPCRDTFGGHPGCAVVADALKGSQTCCVLWKASN